MKPATPRRIWAACSYVPVISALLLFFKGKDSLIFFHARQALWIWLLFVLAVATAMLPGPFFALLKWPLAITAALLFLSLLFQGIADALRGKANPLPPFGDYVQKKNFFLSLNK
ncbi:MAG: hypothetical protein ACOX21_06095 [Bacillota bacterium]|jgi:uncharacterized membrane protein|nr:hypothetical protein [Bacillota bacterium]HOC06565.1 hypothetical protein [Bacillota bacterium]HPZ22897.1 hypothetical protein [Bacillota bacterium]HQD19898.1 hypothetical protein [Bacillota bacterium]